MSKQKFLTVTLCGVLIAGFFALTQNKAMSVFAEAPHPGDGNPVKLEFEHSGLPTPIVSVEFLKSTESTGKPSACVTQEFLDRYFGGSKSAYDGSYVPQAKCWKGYMLATSLNDRIMDDSTSIQEIDTMIKAVQATSNMLNARTTLDGLSVYVIPGGLNTTPRHPFAENIVMKCVRDSAGNTTQAAKAVGTKSGMSSLFFDSAPDSLVKELAELRMANAAKYAEIGAKEKLSTKEIVSVATAANSLNGKLASRHIAVTQEVLLRDYKTLVAKKIPISVSVTLKKDASGRSIDCKDSVPTAISLFGGITGEYVRADVTIDGLMYKDSCIPERHTLSDIKKSMQLHLVRLQKLKDGHIARRDNFKAQLKKMEEQNYNCPTQ